MKPGPPVWQGAESRQVAIRIG